MNFFWDKLPKPIIALAPMAGITDQPFRLMCKKFGADVLYSEMVSSDAIWHQKLKIKNLELKIADENLIKTLKLIKFSSAERPYVVQIFGFDPEKMALVTEYISSGEWYKDYNKLNSKFKFEIFNQIQNSNKSNSLKIKNCKFKIESIPSGIDINMGCPARDVVKVGAGAALMKNSQLAVKIIKSIKKKCRLPVSVKTRLGWDNPNAILKFCRTLEYAGVDTLTIHARTFKQGFIGASDWEMVYKVKKLLKIPVILNGGIYSLNDFKKVDFTRIDGVAIGRGALGRPWIFDEVKNPFLKANSYKLRAVILEHAGLMEKFKGGQGIIEMRKHLAWYFKGIPDSKKIREQLVQVTNFQDIKDILS